MNSRICARFLCFSTTVLCESFAVPEIFPIWVVELSASVLLLSLDSKCLGPFKCNVDVCVAGEGDDVFLDALTEVRSFDILLELLLSIGRHFRWCAACDVTTRDVRLFDTDVSLADWLTLFVRGLAVALREVWWLLLETGGRGPLHLTRSLWFWCCCCTSVISTSLKSVRDVIDTEPRDGLVSAVETWPESFSSGSRTPTSFSVVSSLILTSSPEVSAVASCFSSIRRAKLICMSTTPANHYKNTATIRCKNIATSYVFVQELLGFSMLTYDILFILAWF